LAEIPADLTVKTPEGVSSPPRQAGSDDVASAEAKADRARFGYQPALDGLRAVAVLGVMLYHGLVAWSTGGFLGVDVFFTLSGYLITTLLLLERKSTSTINLGGFWIRRARRLLPALFLVLAVVAIYAAFFADPLELSSIRGDALASLLYVANWRFIFSGQSYFAQFLAPSPLRHTWSLAIEEQWYLFWPIVFTLGFRLTKFRPRNWAVGLLVFAALSGGLMALLYHPGIDPSRIYFGTDTRAQPLLIGAALAFAMHGKTLAKLPTWLLQTMGALGLGGILVMSVVVTDSQGWMYEGGFTLIAVMTCLLIVAVMTNRETVARTILASPPLPLIGRMSYGLYLWHWPIYVFLTSDRTGLNGYALLAVRFVATFAVAAVSYNLVEMPVRKGSLRRLAALVAPRSPGLVVAGATAIAAVLLMGCVVLTTATPSQADQNAILPGDVKALLVGDSVMFTLGNGFTKSDTPGVALDNASIVGCGITSATRRPQTREGRLPPPCVPRLDKWRQAVDTYQPAVTLLAPGVFETYDLEDNGKTYSFGTPEFAKYLQDELDNDLNVLTAKGGKIVLLTGTCFENQTSDGSAVDPERQDQSRLVWVNDQARNWAKKHPNKVKVVDFRGYLCPNNQYTNELNGVKLYRDGEHFTAEGAAATWKWLGPQIKKAAHT
jgi:peptidoglycan/LPS O-acetylase OafA/YrhL